ncbi:hypothetical protein GGQ74_000283 [Desulfobaculum xiamenense]|uniref:Uncharacterized protein n=1 Tax=Desulfobaculum xiamenense TaxID=995050 RepID=A0A846QKD7_9BACT|nr:hypothetical protein [Desulfobaculum xiamenense]NJB66643.1 hypothetical protein [Desulfobaculum xiamenense]
MNTKRRFICFPEMHSPEGPQGVPAGAVLFDPGIGRPEPEFRYAPEALPLDRQTAGQWLGQATGYAEMFRTPGDMRAFAASSEDFFSGSTMDIASELFAMDAATNGRKAEEGRKAALKAQAVLLLAWVREQRLRELGSLDTGLDSAWEKFDMTVGLDPEDRDELEHIDADDFTALGDVSPYGEDDSWKGVLESMLFFLGTDDVLLVREPNVLAMWGEMGIELAPATPELAAAAQAMGLGDGDSLAMVTCPGYRLAGRTSEPADMPWLAAERTVLVALGD